MITLREAQEGDLAAIRKIAEITWQPTYVPIIGQAQVNYMLETLYHPDELLRQLREGHTFILAETPDKICGFAGFSGTAADARLFKLHKLYVLPEAHGLGIGRLLMNEVVKRVTAAGALRLQLNVNRQNKAYDFYVHNGFQVREEVDLDIGSGYFMNDYIMEKTL
ncbi:N-acetyltransferase [Pedobacter yulinensis]|uniref:N-acetyltransferase n=1 Tax=Pedobacter yulinensis TaxID=2126353 RepID=A0A2T3HRY8_9SPHI|nr:GNAT family N-acetyltransferase [Pedobacter yulinensis]PST85189.1 N-acetyltransferase [Pedobacter yulinensis]